MNKRTLRALTHLREQERQAAQQVWQQGQDRLSRMQQLQTQLHQAQQTMQTSGAIDPATLRMRQQFGARLDFALRSGRSQLKAQDQITEEQREALRHRHQQTLIARKLTAREQTLRAAQQLRSEERQLDDFSSARHGRFA
nr:flagellar FliJ family protein [Oceanococcus sp. HetDA_MAG_MS8]